MLGLVLGEEALGLDLRGRSTGKLLVEVDDTLHADSIGSRTDGLSSNKSVRVSIQSSKMSAFLPDHSNCTVVGVGVGVARVAGPRPAYSSSLPIARKSRFEPEGNPPSEITSHLISQLCTYLGGGNLSRFN